MDLLRETGTAERAEPERVQYLLIVALVDNFLGQIQLGNADYDRATELFAAALYDLALSRLLPRGPGHGCYF